MERHQPAVQRHTIFLGDTTIYVPKSSPRDVDVAIFNDGPGTAMIRFSPGQEPVPLSPGAMVTANPDLSISASSAAGCELVVATGVKITSSGTASTAAMSGAELAAIAESRTQKELLVELLLQARIGNRYLEEFLGERFRCTDLD